MIRSLHTAASGMEAQQLRIDTIANNLANVNTSGFKKSRAEFQDLFYQQLRAAGSAQTTRAAVVQSGPPVGLEVGQGTRPVATQKIFSMGELMQTNNPLDLAIEGQGFFKVLRPDGSFAYTRAGAFKTNADGVIVTAEGQPLDPVITIPPDTVNVLIDTDGTIKAQGPGDVDAVEIGSIELVQFVNNAGLHNLGHGLYTETEASGPPIFGNPGEDGLGQIAQGMLESSNVKVVEEMIDLIAAQRAYEINSRVIQTTDEMLRQVTTLR
ncbi:MAG: flagellar basal body rod protein FlgG [Myxococcales bacterium]